MTFEKAPVEKYCYKCKRVISTYIKKCDKYFEEVSDEGRKFQSGYKFVWICSNCGKNEK